MAGSNPLYSGGEEEEDEEAPAYGENEGGAGEGEERVHEATNGAMATGEEEAAAAARAAEAEAMSSGVQREGRAARLVTAEEREWEAETERGLREEVETMRMEVFEAMQFGYFAWYITHSKAVDLPMLKDACRRAGVTFDEAALGSTRKGVLEMVVGGLLLSAEQLEERACEELCALVEKAPAPVEMSSAPAPKALSGAMAMAAAASGSTWPAASSSLPLAAVAMTWEGAELEGSIPPRPATEEAPPAPSNANRSGHCRSCGQCEA